MCQYNLIMVNDASAEEVLIKEEYRLFYKQMDDWMVYHKWHCDCGSFVSEQNEYQDYSYDEFLALKKQKKLEQLIRIKKLMEEPDYNEQLEEYDRFTEYYGKEYITYYEFFDKSTEDEQEVMKDTPEYKRIDSLCQKMLEMDMVYGISKQYVFRREEDPILHISMPTIDEAIAEAKNDDNAEAFNEFNGLYQLFNKILEVSPSIGFGTVWIDINELKEVKTVSMKSLGMEDLAKLKYDEMILITH